MQTNYRETFHNGIAYLQVLENSQSIALKRKDMIA